MVPIITIKRGRDKKIRSYYPWVQREEIAHADGCEPGGIAHLYSSDGEFLAVGTYNPTSRFPFRVFDLEQVELDSRWFEARFRTCKARRKGLKRTDAYRAVFSEADGVPGLIADVFGHTAVIQVRSKGIELLKPHWIEPFSEVFQASCVYEKSDMEGRKEEGLELLVGLLRGALPESVFFEEDGIMFEAMVLDGLKTGFYLDQRATRRRLAERVAPGERVLDAFSYVGAFSLYAAKAGAHVVGLDIHAPAIQSARLQAERNGFSERCEFIECNAFDWLAEEEPKVKFDWMVLDPPAIAKSNDKKTSLKWGIWKLVYSGITHLASGGRMVVCNCSYQLDLEETIATIRLAASDRGKRAFIEEVTYQDIDHPFLAHFPESLYLKCVWVRIEDA